MKVVVLGATSAIAQAAARLWAERGAEILLVGRDPQKVDAVADDLRTRGGQVETLVQDLNQDHAGLVERAASADVMLLAQGIFGDPQRRDTYPDYAELVLRTNLLAPATGGVPRWASTAPPRPVSTRSSRPFASGCSAPECAFSPSSPDSSTRR